MTRTRLVSALLALWSATLAVCVWIAANFAGAEWWPLPVAGVWVAVIVVSFVAALLGERAQRRALSALGEAVGSGPIGKSSEIEHMRAITANLCGRIERAMTYMAAFESLDRPAMLVDGKGVIVKMTKGLTILAPECAETGTVSALLGTEIMPDAEPNVYAVSLSGQRYHATLVPLGNDRWLVELERPGRVVPADILSQIGEALAGGETGYRIGALEIEGAPELEAISIGFEKLDAAVGRLDALAEGDLSVSAGANDRVSARVFTLSRLMSQLDADREAAVLGQQRSRERLEKVGALVEMCRGAAQSLMASAAEARQHLDQARKEAGAGREIAHRAIEGTSELTAGVDQVRSSAEKTRGRVAAVTELVGRIDALVAGIEDVSFRTNLLALNAAVEAARAGEKGAGFAVVASEVRELAQASARASKDVRALVKAGLGEVQAGTAEAEGLAERLTTVTGHLRNLSEQTEMIGTRLGGADAALAATGLHVEAIDDRARQQAGALAAPLV